MCRWVAYIGEKIFIENLVSKPRNSLLSQSSNAQMTSVTTNGDGFGVGWYDQLDEAGIFKAITPAWNNKNLGELCSQTKAHTFFAHVRAATHGVIQRSNSHPFKYKNWIFQHNGDVSDFTKIKRELQFDVSPDLYQQILGTTDSETFFYLAITYGLEENPKLAIEKTIRRIESAQKNAGINVGISLSCAISDGKSVYTARYASDNKNVRTQFYSQDSSCIEAPNGECSALPDNSAVIVSEPLDCPSDKWIEVPINSFMTAKGGSIKLEQLNV